MSAADRRVMGLETEYAFVSERIGGHRAPDGTRPSGNVADFMRLGLRLAYGHTGHQSLGGQFRPNGARLYLDCGDHPEYATPECVGPRQLVAADLAGQRILADGAARYVAAMAATATPVRARVLRSNVDDGGNSWGTHECYQVPAALEWHDLASGIASHLASRVLYTGAGRLEGGAYRLSQRAPHIGTLRGSSATGGSSMTSRPMVLAREEAHADKAAWRRAQVVCGDSNMSEMATFLKMGTTAVALRLVAVGCAPAIHLTDPVGALRTWGSDLHLRATVPSSYLGPRISALEVQRAWLRAAADYHERVGLPPEEATVLAPWAAMLEDLSHPDAAERIADRVDWAAKLTVLRALCARHGLDLTSDDRRLADADRDYHDITPARSVYHRLLAAGHMRRVVTDAEVHALVERPPQNTRAAIRGEVVRVAEEAGHIITASWVGVAFRPTRETCVTANFDDPLEARPSHDVAEVLRALRSTPSPAAEAAA